MTPPRQRPVAVLWTVTWKRDRLRCAVYRSDGRLELRLESAGAVVVSEPFEMQPRALARARMLLRSLTRRGWREARRQAGPPPVEA